MTTTCNECRKPIEAGMAVQRSVSFELVSFHRECYAVRLPAVEPVRVPAQRTGGGSLSERLAAARRSRPA